jgi:hypothetical protein
MGRDAAAKSGEGTDPRQSSVLFSLAELMRIEERRVEEEHASAARRRAERERARRDAEARRAAEEAERALAAEARARAEAEARRAEDAAEEARRLAAIERARLEVEARHAADVAEQRQRHERELAALRNDADKQRLRRNILGIVVVAALTLGGLVGIYVGKIRPDAEAERRALQAIADDRARQADELAAEARKREARLEELDAERARLAATPGASAAPRASAPPVAPRPLVGPTVAPPPKRPCKKTLDPLDDCL